MSQLASQVAAPPKFIPDDRAPTFIPDEGLSPIRAGLARFESIKRAEAGRQRVPTYQIFKVADGMKPGYTYVEIDDSYTPYDLSTGRPVQIPAGVSLQRVPKREALQQQMAAIETAPHVRMLTPGQRETFGLEGPETSPGVRLPGRTTDLMRRARHGGFMDEQGARILGYGEGKMAPLTEDEQTELYDRLRKINWTATTRQDIEEARTKIDPSVVRAAVESAGTLGAIRQATSGGIRGAFTKAAHEAAWDVMGATPEEQAMYAEGMEPALREEVMKQHPVAGVAGEATGFIARPEVVAATALTGGIAGPLAAGASVPGRVAIAGTAAGVGNVAIQAPERIAQDNLTAGGVASDFALGAAGGVAGAAGGEVAGRLMSRAFQEKSPIKAAAVQFIAGMGSGGVSQAGVGIVGGQTSSGEIVGNILAGAGQHVMGGGGDLLIRMRAGIEQARRVQGFDVARQYMLENGVKGDDADLAAAVAVKLIQGGENVTLREVADRFAKEVAAVPVVKATPVAEAVPVVKAEPMPPKFIPDEVPNDRRNASRNPTQERGMESGEGRSELASDARSSEAQPADVQAVEPSVREVVAEEWTPPVDQPGNVGRVTPPAPSRPAATPEAPKPAPAPAPAKGKEPWEMTAAQFRKEKTTQHHGTSEKEPFVTFKPKSLGSYGEHPYHYFSDSPKVLDRMKKAGADANAIPVARVISAKLNATSPLDLSNVGELTPREWAAELERRGISIPEKYRDKIERAENQRGKIPAWNFFKTDTGELQAELIKAGYDSVKWKEWGATTTAVFRPDQVLTHRQLVEKAISEGKPVPPRVLADYPDLAKKGASTTPPKFIPDEGAPHASSIESPTPMGGKQGGPEGPGQGRPAGVPGVVEGSGPAGKAPQAEPPRAATPERAKVGEGPSSQGPGAAESTDPTAFTPPEPTGLKHASVAKERERLGLGERVKFGPVHDNQVIDAAVQRHLSDPTYGARLADAISKKPRTLEIEEIADLLVNQRYLLNERARIEEEIVKADESGADAESLRDHLAATLAALEQNFRASEFGGTRQGLAFRARRWMMAEGYTLTEMERSYKAAKGSELTETETAKLKDLSEKIAAAQKQLEAVNKRLSDEARKRVEAEVAAKIRKEKEAEEYRNSRDKTPTDPAGMRKRMLDGIKTSPDDPARWIQEIFKSYVEEGVAKKEPHTPEARERYLDQTLADVNGVLPDMTRQEVSDAITGYGDYRLLSKEEADVRYRQMRGELRELAKLEDVNAKRPPKKTGMERQSPSDEQRRIDKVLAERMKQMGIVVTDPESQLRSALQSRETYYENRIKDLKFEIAKGEVTVKAKGPQPTSAKLDALKKELDTVIKEHKAIFGDPKMSDEARLKAAIKATERADAEIQRRIQSGEWAPTPRERMSLTSPALEAARNKANASRETLKLLRDLDEATTNAKANARADAQIKALNQQIAELEGQVQGSRPLAQQAGAKPEARPDVQALRDRRAELVKLRDRLRTPGKSAEELALQAAKARMLHQMGELSEKIVTGDYAPAGPREGIKLNPELLRLQADLNKYKQAYEAGKRRYDWDRKSLASKAGYYAGDVLNLPKAIRATLDFSAVLRQGGFITLGRPDLAAKNFAPMIRAAVSDSYSRVVWERIKARPNAELYAQSKLYLADNTKLSTQEERFIGHITKHIPGIAGSERAYTTFLNLLRADTFDTLVKLLPEGQRTQSNMEAIANYINVATGRGALGRFEVARPALSTVLWSPGQALSRAQLLAGQPFYRGSAATRKIIAKEYARFGTGLAVFAGIAMAAGFRFGFDPKSSDFGKLIKGDTRIDLMGGMSQWAVLLTRLLSGESSNARGDSQAVRGEAVSFGGDDASDLIWRFVRSKLTPAIGSTINVLAGKNVVGEPTSVGKELRESVTPLVLVDIYEAMKSRGMTEGGILSVFAILGAGVQTYQPRRGAHADIVADLRAGKVRPADVAKLIPGTDKKAERERNAVLQQAAYLDDDAWAFYQMPYEKAVRALEGDAAAAARPARKRAMMPVESYGDVLRKRIEASDLTAEQKKAMKARIPK